MISMGNEVLNHNSLTLLVQISPANLMVSLIKTILSEMELL